MNRDHMFYIGIACIFLGLLIEGFLFAHEAKAQVIVIDPISGGVKDIVIMPMPAPTR